MEVMDKREIQVRDVSTLDVEENLREQILIMSEKCIKCKLCQKECAFLRKYGKPKDIADLYDPNDKLYQGMPFECSLCQLCAAVCPVKINPTEMFLDMRRETVRRGIGYYPEHATILRYEKRGISKKYTFYSLPHGCDTIFFPGCALSGTHPQKVIEVYEHLSSNIRKLGIVLDCCTLPSHDLGRADYFQRMFDEMKAFLLSNGIRQIIVACPSCFKVFKRYGNELTVKTVYEMIIETALPETGRLEGTVTIHDSCASRFEKPVHDAIRDLVGAKGLTLKEMPHSRMKTLCCGEGGSVSFLNPELAKNWSHLRRSEAVGNNRVLTYCAGCVNSLGSSMPTTHILDLLFEPENAMTGKAKVSKSPFTYLNRIRLKKHFKKTLRGTITRERAFTVGEESKKGSLLQQFLILFFIIAAIFIIHSTGKP